MSHYICQAYLIVHADAQTGGLAILEREGRYIYYLVTKDKYYNKPTYPTLNASLEAMHAHCLSHQVAHLAMPRIGCGLDRLDWDRVAAMLKEVFNQDENHRVFIGGGGPGTGEGEREGKGRREGTRG